MKRKKLYILIFTPVLILALYLLYYEGADVLQRHYERDRIAETDAKVIKKLKKIRLAQKAYYSVNKEYAADWHDLIDFLDKGEFPIIQKKETIIDLNGEDSISVRIDTVGMISVFDSLKNSLGYSKREELPAIAFVPMSDTTFVLYANVYGEGRDKFQVVEVTDPKPYNPRRKEDGDMQPLKFGAKAQATTKGNWE